MSAELEKSNQKVERIRVAIRGIAWKDKDLYVLTSNLSAISVDEQLAVANNKSDRVYENMRVLYKEADSIHKDALYKLRMKLQDLQSNGDDKIGGAEEKGKELSQQHIIRSHLIFFPVSYSGRTPMAETRRLQAFLFSTTSAPS